MENSQMIGDGPHGLTEVELFGNDHFVYKGEQPEVLPKPYVVFSARFRLVDATEKTVVIVCSEKDYAHYKIMEDRRRKVGRVGDALWEPGKGRLKDAKQFLLDLCNVRF